MLACARACCLLLSAVELKVESMFVQTIMQTRQRHLWETRDIKWKSGQIECCCTSVRGETKPWSLDRRRPWNLSRILSQLPCSSTRPCSFCSSARATGERESYSNPNSASFLPRNSLISYCLPACLCRPQQHCIALHRLSHHYCLSSLPAALCSLSPTPTPQHTCHPSKRPAAPSTTLAPSHSLS